MIWIFCVLAIFAPLWNITIRYYTLSNKSSMTRRKRHRDPLTGEGVLSESLCAPSWRRQESVATQAYELLVSSHIRGGKSNQGVSLIESMAEVIAVAPRAIATSESPQIATMTASAEAPLATTAVQIILRFFK